MSEIDIREPIAKAVRFSDNGKLNYEDEKRFSIEYGSTKENPNECILPINEIDGIIKALRTAKKIWSK